MILAAGGLDKVVEASTLGATKRYRGTVNVAIARILNLMLEENKFCCSAY